jgi:DNA-binding NarL/FixJ family response regulator
MKTIIIADDHSITLLGMQNYLKDIGYNVIGTYKNGQTAYENAIQLKPDVLILDINMPIMNGLEVLKKIKKDAPEIKVIIYTMHNEKFIYEKAKNKGVNGYLLKDFALEEIAICLEKILDGKNWFSPRLVELTVEGKYEKEVEYIALLTASEMKILELIARDFNTKNIANKLFISEKTVENHRSNIIKKLQLPNENNILSKFIYQQKILELFENNLI